ncbi:hypothetical protein COU89_03540 [Candidatus Roizmanbacteria bacterium CG10_big_fil_rev_8_21_14_0_10_45_7]|uniref:Uncharacterized protein n=1 Tax=Candidatus Roizmanbacteria bacterium CG10_big_fil_rev_8_21_14_0_10_45_7 TaxID=1974854 RepID=A0A2M8KTZ2_9BACT|nr:MAG: hypothetical protein COU89_03540 [Candidatus Roizmanbacteria bacterium CG10_big_fil_rev_8_21_14_0_10_45_7]
MQKQTLTFTSELIGMVVTTFLALFFALSPFAQYDLQLIAVLFIIYMLLRKRLAQQPLFYLYESLGFIFIVLVAVFSTGGVISPFFFLIYFLLFALVLLLDATSSVVLTLLLVIVFLTTSNTGSLSELIPVFSLPFIAPFAQYLGMVRQKYAQQKQLVHTLEEKKSKVERTKNYQKEQTLLFLTTNLFRLNQDMKDRLDNFMGDADLQVLKDKVREVEALVHSFRDYVEKI